MLNKEKKNRQRAEQYADRIVLTDEVIFRKVDKTVREKKLYLEPGMTMDDIADILGTNRTYVSRALKSHAGGFVNYMRNLRVERLHEYINEADEEGRMLEDGEDLAMHTGFVNKRAMVRALKKVDGKSLYEIKNAHAESKKSLPLSK